MNWALFLPLALAGLLVGVVFHALPALRKRNLYFGVTVDETFRSSPEGRAIATAYRWWVWLGVLAGWAASAVAISAHWTLVLGLSPLLATLAGSAAWIQAWSRVRPHAARIPDIRVASLSTAAEKLPGGWLTIVGPYTMLGAAFAWLWSHYDALPVHYPVHWGPSGNADRWVEKNPQSVLFPALIGAGVITLLSVTVLSILYFSKRGSGSATDFGTRHRRMNIQLLAVVLWCLGPLFCFVTLLPLLPPMGLWMEVPMLAPVAVILFMTYRLYSLSTEPAEGSDGTPEDCWKFGSIYYNPADPALMVEKRSGPGFTVNFGHPASWLLLAGILAFALIPGFLAR
jgi:uncharacterized membrane protein